MHCDLSGSSSEVVCRAPTYFLGELLTTSLRANERLVPLLYNDFAAYEGYIAEEPVRPAPIESAICPGQTLAFVRLGVLSSEYLQRSESGVTQRKPGEGITGPDWANLDVRLGLCGQGVTPEVSV